MSVEEEVQLFDFWVEVNKERARQTELGYSAKHDDEHGIDHLLSVSLEYLLRGDTVKAAAVILAAQSVVYREYTRKRRDEMAKTNPPGPQHPYLPAEYQPKG